MWDIYLPENNMATKAIVDDRISLGTKFGKVHIWFVASLMVMIIPVPLECHIWNIASFLETMDIEAWKQHHHFSEHRHYSCIGHNRPGTSVCQVVRESKAVSQVRTKFYDSKIQEDLNSSQYWTAPRPQPIEPLYKLAFYRLTVLVLRHGQELCKYRAWFCKGVSALCPLLGLPSRNTCLPQW